MYLFLLRIDFISSVYNWRRYDRELFSLYLRTPPRQW